LKIGDLVAVMPPQALAEFLVNRGYIGRDTPLLKHVAALPGQEVCRIGRTVTVDAVPFGDALDHDRLGRELPIWRGCRRIAEGDVFLMNSSVRDSLDGRYFGSIPTDAVIGKATPLFTDEDGDGHFVWRAPIR
jgi:conjugative transfer signal peptidase TraF